MAKIKKYEGQNRIKVNTRSDTDPTTYNSRWWMCRSKDELCSAVFGVVNYLRQNQTWRIDQSAMFARMYANLPIWNYLGTSFKKSNGRSNFPQDRPTYNVVQSCVDTLVSRMVQSKPKPFFLTSGGSYKQRRLAKELNKFIEGEFYRCKVYDMREQNLRTSCILGDGVIKIYQTEENKVGLEHVLCTELYVDEIDAMYGKPQQMHQVKLIDRDVAAEMFPGHRGKIMTASNSFFDSSPDSTNTIVSQIALVESWHLKSGPEAKDGLHTICIENATLLEEDYEYDYFPFAKFPYAPRTLGYWSQGMPERLSGLQISINQLLYTQHMGLHLCGIPHWLIEDGSKIVSAHINNQIGGQIKYQGTPPVLQSSQVFPPEIYNQLDRYINMAFQQEGISQLAATSQKPAGLNSGKALREYDDIQTDRFAALAQRDQDFIVRDLSAKMFDLAKKIAKEEGSYETIFPDKSSTLKIDLAELDFDDEFIIQAFPRSGYSNDPAFRKQEIVEDMQAGLLSPEEGYRLLDFPDTKQVTQLKTADEERIYQLLDKIIEDGEYNPPDQYMNLKKAKILTMRYYNFYTQFNLEEDKAAMLRDFMTQIDLMNEQAMQAQMMMQQQAMAAQAQPMAPPQNEMIPNVPGMAA